ncbi:NAD(P)-dependent dehydrogenase, short-chain alcohol dehydrogenase family [Natronoarchaeum philippinense]|uniref:NAD(P)-dependent dehydrogenase, short-chain alcohol dehydrogenase family n=1 Tax=Natronoarchaeum philippinense TaxID=558529 RepID=A0A285PA47_NATPI|nr:SDR family oxidoreductase [Natronoarchaeum philippinense]SNZ18083.1 NAD(P)-dependent dehydrogenase, short-chain alcohol dehydrogenase family [Natronoarchaeum philippinense]
MDDATAVVTGATRGIGRAVAEEFAAAGAHVVCCAREADDVDALVEDIEAEGGTVTGVRADVRDEYDVERLLGTAVRVGGEIDIVVACAGVYHGTPGETPIDDEAYAAYDDHLRTNARGVFATLREAAPHLAPEARVLVPTGRVARDGTPGIGSYAVSKAAAEAIARGFAADLEQTVGCVDPGQVSTGLSGDDGRDPPAVAPMFRWAAVDAPAEDIDGAVVGLREWKTATR